MPTMRVTKRYNNLSPLSGIIVEDTIKFETREDGAKWVARMLAPNNVPWDLLDYSWALIAAPR